MNKEPIALYIFRFVLGLGLFAFMTMLYWSSVLLEEEVKDIQLQVGQLKTELFSIKTGIEKVQASLLQGVITQSTSTPTSPRNSSKEAKLQDPGLPNLLQEDPFYAETLPNLLGPNFKPQGTFHNAVLGRPNNLHPFTNWYQVSIWQNLCSVSVARLKFGKYETFAPDMAIKVEERKDPATGMVEFWVHLRDGVYWHPLRSDLFTENIDLAPHFMQKHQVTAADFKFYYDAIMNPHVQDDGAVALRNFFSDIQAIEILDPLTFIVRWKAEQVKESDGKVVPKVKYVARQLTGGLKPLASFVYQYFPDGTKIVEDAGPETYRTNSVWAQNFSQHWAKNIIVGCGAWIFDGMTDRQISFKRNPEHYFPYDALAEASEYQFKDSADSLWQDFKANKIDSYEMRPDQLLELTNFMQSPQYQQQSQAGAAIHRLDYLAYSYTYVGWNESKPYFKSKKVRQALSMAIDRQRIIRQNLNGLGIEINGTFYRYSPAYDASIPPWPYDPQAAKRLLEEEGWYDRSGNGILENEIDGKKVPFRFSLTYYVKSPTGKAIVEYISTALKEIGIICTPNGVDIADLSAAFVNKSFDALTMAWMLGTPPDDPKQLWDSSGAKLPGSSNSIGFANAEADSIIKALEYEADPKKRIALYHRFDAIIHDEAPYTFLYTPKTVLLYRDYLQNVFIPAERQDLIPGANVAQPETSIFWLKHVPEG